MSEKEAEQFRAKFFQSYQGLATWHKPSLNEVLNMPVQGTSADMTKQALANLPTALEGTGAKVIGVVHDEIILEVVEEKAYDAARILERVMVEAGQMFLVKVPVEVEVNVCNSWGG